MKRTYIPPEYYPAVMFARKMIREGGYAGLSIWKAAKYYGVDHSILASYINGKKRTYTSAEKSAWKYYWAVVYVASGVDPTPSIHTKIVGQTNNRSNEERKLDRRVFNASRRADSGSDYSPYYTSKFCARLFDTETEAINDMEQNIKQYLAEWGEEYEAEIIVEKRRASRRNTSRMEVTA